MVPSCRVEKGGRELQNTATGPRCCLAVPGEFFLGDFQRRTSWGSAWKTGNLFLIVTWPDRVNLFKHLSPYHTIKVNFLPLPHLFFFFFSSWGISSVVLFPESPWCWPAQISQPKQVPCEFQNSLLIYVPSSGPSLKCNKGREFRAIALGLDPSVKNFQEVKLFYFSWRDVL